MIVPTLLASPDHLIMNSPEQVPAVSGVTTSIDLFPRTMGMSLMPYSDPGLDELHNLISECIVLNRDGLFLLSL